MKVSSVTLWEFINHLEYKSACEAGSPSVLECEGKSQVVRVRGGHRGRDCVPVSGGAPPRAGLPNTGVHQ